MHAQTPDVKELIGLLMRVVGGGEAKISEIEELAFSADASQQPILNAAYIKLLEFAFDGDERAKDPEFDARARATLEEVLNELGHLAR